LKSKCQEKASDFKNKALLCHGIDVLGKEAGDLTEGGFHSLSHRFTQELQA
jgi:hypothetical protein